MKMYVLNKKIVVIVIVIVIIIGMQSKERCVWEVISVLFFHILTLDKTIYHSIDWLSGYVAIGM